MCYNKSPQAEKRYTEDPPRPPTGAHCKHHICRAKQHQQQGKVACARGSAASIWCRRSRGDMLGSTPVMPLDLTTLAPRMSRWPRLPGPPWNWTTRNLPVSAKFGMTKKLLAPNLRLLPCQSKRSAVFRPSVPGTSDVLSGNVLERS